MQLEDMYVPDLLSALPSGNEDDKWELKSAEYLQPAKRGELKRELGKQVSAFANSGGGYLTFGIDDQRQPQECETTVGRQSMKDFLSTLVEQSVEYPIRDFRVHPIQFGTSDTRSIYVIEIGDSMAAPHQAKLERNYFYRIDGHSKPAPHFHVELLRNRLTKAVVSIQDVDLKLTKLKFSNQGNIFRLKLELSVVVLNESLQSADPWGVHAQAANSTWLAIDGKAKKYRPRVCAHGDGILLPDDLGTVHFEIETTVELSRDEVLDRFLGSEIYGRWKTMEMVLRPVSQNCIGPEVKYPSIDRDVEQEQLEMFRHEIQEAIRSVRL